MKIIEKDIAIIGAGPAGLFAVFECGFLGYQCVVLDALPEIGGQLTALYPEKPIYDIPGHPTILAKDLINNLAKQAEPFAPEYCLNQPVKTLEKLSDGTFKLCSNNLEINVKIVILAGGGGMFTPRKPPLENLEKFENNIDYAITNKQKFAGKNLVIAGGGDSAVDWAVELATIANHIHVVHRRPDFRAVEATVNKMHALAKAGKISLHTPAQLRNLAGENGNLKQVIIADLDGNETKLEASNLLCFFGIAPNPGSIGQWGIDMNGKAAVTEAVTQKTSMENVLAIGDMAGYEGRSHLIVAGFAEAAQAAKTARSIINPEKSQKIPFSTAKKPEALR